MAGLLSSMAGLTLTGSFAGAQLRVPTPAARVSAARVSAAPAFNVVAVRLPSERLFPLSPARRKASVAAGRDAGRFDETQRVVSRQGRGIVRGVESTANPRPPCRRPAFRAPVPPFQG